MLAGFDAVCLLFCPGLCQSTRRQTHATSTVGGTEKAILFPVPCDPKKILQSSEDFFEKQSAKTYPSNTLSNVYEILKWLNLVPRKS